MNFAEFAIKHASVFDPMLDNLITTVGQWPFFRSIRILKKPPKRFLRQMLPSVESTITAPPATLPTEGGTRTWILPGRPSLDRNSRDSEVGFEQQAFRSVSRSLNH
ncbi:hypothetical protein T265_08588 [Opisthorchis viverrini]|uniref:Uncharacterized protein n=1 Tax=Opisthorchis viverrini TaxID=6198 RepID=A0A074ZD19_OPIVI|nr:hypothetical protein T265_08588 [Opisthorchis viverrini]KER23547.1 hypothetical protein T265_08588 [Opisthorchis viverrini]